MREQHFCNFCSKTKPETDFSDHSRWQARTGDENAACLQCVDMMYRGRVSRAEAVAAVKEQTDHDNERKRLPGQEERKNKHIRWGRALHHSEVITTLKRLIPTLYAHPGGIPGDISLYDTSLGYPRYLSYLHEGWSPEYSIVIVDKHNLPVSEKRGWRTVLLRMIQNGFLSEEQALRGFGHPTNGDAAKFYKEQLFNFRNERGFHVDQLKAGTN